MSSIAGDEFLRIVQYDLHKNGNVETVNLISRLDSGSPISFIKEKYVDQKRKLINKINLVEYAGINGAKLNYSGAIKVMADMGGGKREVTLLIVDDSTMQAPVILGRDAFKSFDLKLIENVDGYENANSFENAVTDILNIDIEVGVFDKCDDLKINPKIPRLYYDIIKKIFFENYVQPDRPEVPRVNAELRVELREQKPFQFKPIRLSFAEKLKLRKIIDELLRLGRIRISDSEYCSPVILVKKKTGELRMCIDYRVLNKLLLGLNYPIPLIEDQLDVLSGKKYFSILDLKDGFHHIKIAEESRKYTSFITPFGQYEFLCMPFGLKVAPARFQRFVNEVLKELIVSGDVVVYFDDIMVATETIEQHIELLKRIFELFVENKMELRLDKCEFLATEVEFLGYVVSEKGIRPSEKGISAIKNFPVPLNVKGVQSFLGVAQYFRKHVEGFSTIAGPLYELTKKGKDFVFGETQMTAFEMLKNKLIQAPILALYDPRRETELHCDASSLGFGAVLLQKQKDLKFHPVFFFSKRTSEVEGRYHSFELEMLAIIYALRRFRVYLLSMPFKIVTDCNSLTLALKKKDINTRIARWVMELQDFDYSTEHREGKRMLHVDGLSRCIGVVEDNSIETNLLYAQSKDEEICKIRDKLEKFEDGKYELRNGIVYRKINNGESLVFCVPKLMEKNIIFKYHDEMGHQGVNKVYENLQQNYWFPKMKDKITDHIANCCKCIAFSPASGKIEGLVQIIPKESVPFDSVHIDHIDIIDCRVKSKKHILVVVDAFTKFVKLFPTKTTTSGEAIACLKGYFANYSKPRVIIADRGTAFTSKEFVDFLDEYDIVFRKIATASPQANGQVERVNRVLAPMLGKLSDEAIGKSWPKVITEVEYAINNSANVSTAETPSRLLFGVGQRGKVPDNIVEYLKDNVNAQNRDLTILREKASEQMSKAQEKYTEYANRKRKDAKIYKEGDYVMIRNFDVTKGVSSKLIPKFKGPYIVKKVLRNQRYVIADIDGLQITQRRYEGVWEPRNMRRWLHGESGDSGEVVIDECPSEDGE